MTNFKIYEEWMHKRDEKKGKHTLENVSKLLAHFDNPQDKIKVIHVAGTNGKGSTCYFLSSVLKRKNKTGLFISPYMDTMTESITINGVKIPEERFIEYVELFKPVLEKLDKEGYKNTYFEVLTAIMYKYFYDEKVDVAVVEVGMGGTLDSTNIIKKPIASVITTISMDHVGILGNTIEEIAGNKAGIIKEDSPVFLYPKEKNLFRLFSHVAQEKNAPLYTFSEDEINIKKSDANKNMFDFREHKDMETMLLGHHQILNASLAIMVLDYLKYALNITDEDIRLGIKNAKNPGRVEIISKNPTIIIDGSHNKESVSALIAALKMMKYDRLIVGFSILKDKDYDFVIKNLASIADEFVITTIDNPQRAFKLNELETIVKKYTPNVTAVPNRIEAFEYSKTLAKSDDIVLWCGSLYLIREILKYTGEFKNMSSNKKPCNH